MNVERRTVRCAIYTRKSSEEGLEQDFNSLDAQFEACAAYVASLKHEGWKSLPTRYDDGGFSGGTLERPGLRRLLTEIEAGKVDMVVRWIYLALLAFITSRESDQRWVATIAHVSDIP